MDLTTLILNDSYTKPEALRRVRVLRETASSRFFGGERSVGVDLGEDQDSEFLAKFDSKVFDSLDRKKFDETFDQVEKEIKEIEALVIYLPFVPPTEEIGKIVRRIRTDYGQRFVVEIKVDPKLIAGCALSFGGIYKDYSIRARLGENRGKIQNLLEKYFRGPVASSP